MSLSDEDLFELVSKASTCDERQTVAFVSTSDETDQARSRLERWRETLALDGEAFERRLEWDEMDVPSALKALGPARLAPGEALPGWARTLQAALEAPASEEGAPPCSAERGAEPRPFPEVLALFVRGARHALRARLGARYPLLGPAAHGAFEDALERRLAQSFAPTLYLEFALRRGFARSSLSRHLGEDEAPPTVLYQGFVHELLDGGLRDLLREYAVLARITGEVLESWVEATAEFVEHLDADRPELVRAFAAEADPGPVTTVAAGLSDYHRGGRAVVIATFASGLKLVYKPRPLAVEDRYVRLLEWLNERGASPRFRTFVTLDRGTHGWVEFVSQAGCESAEQLGRFYRRAGALLALVYALGGTDCQFENLIASGEHPVLIDLEALVQPRLPQAGAEPEPYERYLARTREFFWNSVLRTGLLPSWSFSPDWRGAFDTSALGAEGDQPTPFRIPVWRHANTDHMVPDYEFVRTRVEANRPFLHGVPASPAEWPEDIVAGFRDTYLLLLRHRDEALAPGGPVAALASARVRFFFRPTNAYGSVLKFSLGPELLRDGADYSIALDLFSREALRAGTSKPEYWPVLVGERRALVRRDIPYFEVDADSRELVLPDSGPVTLFERSGYEGCVATLALMSEPDLDLQVTLIHGALYAHAARKPGGAASGGSRAKAAWAPSEGELVDRALQIADDLQRLELDVDGASAWLGLEYEALPERFQLRILGPGLYSGATGVALFLAGVAAVTGRASARASSLRALKPVRWMLRSPLAREAARQLDVGAAEGLGAVVYGLTCAARVLSEPGLLEEALRAARLITPERLASDARLDVMSGCAGAVLGLLALHHATHDPEALALAMHAGERLLAARTDGGDGPRAWKTLGQAKLTGLSHGAAGIAYALARLRAASGDERFLDAAREAVAYERSVFSPEQRNWPDLREPAGPGQTPAFAMAWCHGAPGIGLARVGALDVLDGPDIRDDVRVALEVTASAGPNPVEYLCCGNFGRVEVLTVAAERLREPALRERALNYAAAVQPGTSGPLRLFANLPAEANGYGPGFFVGMAGIGYQLLRLAHPGQLPSVLLWE